MKLITIKFIPFLLFLAIGCTSCKDDDSDITCENGLELIDGSCQCPANKFRIGENCRGLNENEYWATMPSSYPCRDTFLLDFGLIDSVEESIEVEVTILNAEAFDGLTPIQNFSDKFYFKENTARKEFYTTNDRYPFCEINEIKTGTNWEGKFLSDTELYVKMYHRNITNVYEVIDSTELVFRKEVP